MVLAAVVALHREWDKRVERRLDRRLAAPAAAGEPTTPAALLELPVPDSDNAALDLRAAAAEVKDADLFWMVDTEPAPAPPLGESEVGRIERLLDGREVAIGRVRAARAKSRVDWQVRFRDPMLLTPEPDHWEYGKLIDLLGVNVLYEHERGRDAEAVELVRDLLFIGRTRGQKPGSRSYLPALPAYSTAADRLAQIAPDLRIAHDRSAADVTAATPAQVGATIRELLDDAPARDAMRRSFQAARVEQLDAARAMANGRLPFSDLFTGCTMSTSNRPPAAGGSRSGGAVVADGTGG